MNDLIIEYPPKRRREFVAQVNGKARRGGPLSRSPRPFSRAAGREQAKKAERDKRFEVIRQMKR